MGDEQQRAGELAQVGLRASWIASMSRWFVGSSSSSRSGSETSALPSSVRRRHPPESSPSGSIRRQRQAATRSVSTFCSSRQPSRSSSSCCSSPSRSSPFSVFGVVDRRMVVSRHEVTERAQTRRRPRRTRCDRRRRGRPGRAATRAGRGRARSYPPSGGTSPAMTLSRLDLPAPLRPMRQMRSPASIRKSALSNSGRCPKDSETPESVIRGTAEVAEA